MKIQDHFIKSVEAKQSLRLHIVSGVNYGFEVILASLVVKGRSGGNKDHWILKIFLKGKNPSYGLEEIPKFQKRFENPFIGHKVLPTKWYFQ